MREKRLTLRFSSKEKTIDSFMTSKKTIPGEGGHYQKTSITDCTDILVKKLAGKIFKHPENNIL